MDSTYDEVLEMIDCEYELRVYAPVGGVDGSITLVDAVEATTEILTVDMLNYEVADDLKSVSFHGCQDPLPEKTVVIGDVHVCTDIDHNSDTDVVFNQDVRAPVFV